DQAPPVDLSCSRARPGRRRGAARPAGERLRRWCLPGSRRDGRRGDDQRVAHRRRDPQHVHRAVRPVRGSAGADERPQAGCRPAPRPRRAGRADRPGLRHHPVRDLQARRRGEHPRRVGDARGGPHGLRRGDERRGPGHRRRGAGRAGEAGRRGIRRAVRRAGQPGRHGRLQDLARRQRHRGQPEVRRRAQRRGPVAGRLQPVVRRERRGQGRDGGRAGPRLRRPAAEQPALRL
ncbi:MAG: hypothetical protein AVDCRST_MAG60-2051, partial [uncultured Nocardioides sp.]